MVGADGPISRFLAGVHFLWRVAAIVACGYSQQRTAVFRVPILFGDWFYVASGRSRVQEMASAPDDATQVNYTLGVEILMQPYHALVIRGILTRNLGRCFPQMRDELVHAFDDVLALNGDEWKLVQVQPALLQIVARTNNRVFVGLPLCGDLGYLKLNIDFAVAVFLRAQFISMLPDVLKPILGPVFWTRRSSRRRARAFLGPLLEERLEKERQYGRDWPGRPNDLISWLLELAEGAQRTAPDLAMRILTVNFAAIHTTSMTLTDALYDLAAHPAHIAPLREEVARAVAVEGWTKAALGRMHALDSFLRESQRLGGLGPFAMGRKVVAPGGFTFEDGTTVP
ncbi:cytochrome P450 [Mycena pura]|uniref:Cytochrome P450 n=1 Tax=Mycena pura TaxID=153505 RepID=A0AAD6UNU8_9AGAR|nr:cytochrome P450 [Mycena pura]